MRYRFAIGVMLLAQLVAGVAHADIKLAYVDIQRALNECHNGKEAKQQFRVRVQRLEAQLQGEQNEVENLKDELQKKGPLMQPDERQNLEDEYTRKLQQFQDDYKNSREELQQRDNEMTGEIVRDLAVVVRQIGIKNGYTMVMEKGSLLWATASIDITDQVIRAYDAMNVKPGSLGAEADAPSGTAFGSAAGGSRPSAADSMPEPGDDEGGGRSTISK
ncbi:MAG TPA: OmpH family outer membrane protein [Candidatus Binataceae bacterium]|nr:OmpH family outer membrane protein [Candidatus Binataceae bacterium]